MLVLRYKLSLCHTPIKPDLLGFPGIGVFACELHDHVITRFTSVLLSPMNTYFKLSGKGFNSNSGACKIDDKSFLCESTKSTKTLPWGTVCKA